MWLSTTISARRTLRAWDSACEVSSSSRTRRSSSSVAVQGEISRMLAPHVGAIDAVDVSAAMLAKPRSMPGGEHSAIRWIHGRAEEVAFDPPYGLAIAGDSLHWMQWETVLPRVRVALDRGAHLALVSAITAPTPWSSPLSVAIARYSVMREFERYDLLEVLEGRQAPQTDRARLDRRRALYAQHRRVHRCIARDVRLGPRTDGERRRASIR